MYKKLLAAATKLFICLFYCYVMMETKDVQLQDKAELISIFVAPPVAQDQRSYSICVLSHELSVSSSYWHRHHCSQYL